MKKVFSMKGFGTIYHDKSTDRYTAYVLPKLKGNDADISYLINVFYCECFAGQGRFPRVQVEYQNVK